MVNKIYKIKMSKRGDIEIYEGKQKYNMAYLIPNNK